MIELSAVTKIYQSGEISHRALDEVNLSIAQGDMLAIMGASGSGKSSLLNILGLLDKHYEGQYTLQGEDVTVMNDKVLARVRNQHIGFIFQQFHLLPRLTVFQNIALPLQYQGVPGSQIADRINCLLEQVGMPNYGKHFPNQLSGGQQQRVAIARALITEPSLLLADEPTGALDSKTGKEVMALFHHLHQTLQKTLVVVTHDPLIAVQCERQVQLHDGRIIKDAVRETA